MNSWKFELNLDSIEYVSKELHFLDVWHEQNSLQPQIREGTLDSDTLDTYLFDDEGLGLAEVGSDNHGKSCTSSPSLRLIYASSDEGHDELIMMSRPDFEKVIQCFNLPKRYAELVQRSHCVMSECWGDQIRPSLGDPVSYILSTPFDHSPLWSMAASYNPQTNVTTAYLQLTSFNANEILIPHLKQFVTNTAAAGIIHPLVPALAVIDIETHATLGDDLQFSGRIRSIEDEIGFSNLHEPELYVSLSEQKRKELIQRTNAASLFINRIERESQEVLLHLKEIATMLDGSFAKIPELTSAGENLKKHVRFLVNSRENVFVRLRALQMKCETLLKLLYNWPD